MLKWPDILTLAKNGKPAPDRSVVKNDEEWRQQLSDQQYHVTREAGALARFRGNHPRREARACDRSALARCQ
jgi:peptide-methionine (R)-S-oxide reductase